MQYLPTFLSLLCSLCSLIMVFVKTSSKSSAELTTVIVKLENIQDSNKEIKQEILSLRNDYTSLTERIIKLEERVYAHD